MSRKTKRQSKFAKRNVIQLAYSLGQCRKSWRDMLKHVEDGMERHPEKGICAHLPAQAFILDRVAEIDATEAWVKDFDGKNPPRQELANRVNRHEKKLNEFLGAIHKAQDGGV